MHACARARGVRERGSDQRGAILLRAADMPFRMAVLPLELTPRPTDRARLHSASHLVRERLYVLLDGDWSTISLADAEERVAAVYYLAGCSREALDVRVLLPGADGIPSAAANVAELDALLAPAKGSRRLLHRLNDERARIGLQPMRCEELPEWPLPSPDREQEAAAGTQDVERVHGSDAWLGSGGAVCVGGTFDRLHSGHKLLLSKAALLTRQSLLIGVTDAPLLRSKGLRELMQSLPHRAAAAEEFVRSVRPGIRCSTVALSTPLGPAATDGRLQTLVASEETLAAASVANDARRDADLPPLRVSVTSLVPSPPLESVDNTKMSSTYLRRRDLGTFLRPSAFRRAQLPSVDEWARRRSSRGPYLIGLTGGIASGKSTIAADLAATGVTVIDADSLGHELYRPQGAAVNAVIDAFGPGVAAKDGGVDRKSLARIVWSDPEAMERLSSLMWPRMLRLAARRAIAAARDGADIVVLEAAVLLEAGWDACCDEVWMCSVSEAEQRRRLMSRDDLDEATANERISAQARKQPSVSEATRRVHVVLTTEGFSGGGDEDLASDSAPEGNSPLAQQLRLSLAGARARGALDLKSAAGGSAAQLWWSLCAELRVGEAAARHWWRWLLERHSAPQRHCHDVEWMRHVASEVGSRRSDAARPAALRLASFFAEVDDRGGADAASRDEDASAAIMRFARCAPGLTPSDATLATRLVQRAASEAAEASDRDLEILTQAQQRITSASATTYASYAARLGLERRCQQADDLDGVGCAVRVASQRVAEIEDVLHDRAGVDDSAVGEMAVADANLQAERRLLRRLVLEPAEEREAESGSD